MAQSQVFLCKLGGNIRTTKMAVLVMHLFALRSIAMYAPLCSLSRKANHGNLNSQMLLTDLHGRQWKAIQEQTESRWGNFSCLSFSVSLAVALCALCPQVSPSSLRLCTMTPAPLSSPRGVNRFLLRYFLGLILVPCLAFELFQYLWNLPPYKLYYHTSAMNECEHEWNHHSTIPDVSSLFCLLLIKA